MAQTVTPIIYRHTLRTGPNVILAGEIPGAGAGVIVYVYLNLRRAGTAITLPNGKWNTGLTFGGGAQVVKPRDRIYATARAVGEETSDRTTIYTLDGIEQPGAPFAFDEVTTEVRQVFERDRIIQGDVPLPIVFFPDNPTVGVFLLFNSDTSVGLEEGATVSIYLDGTFLTSVQTDKIGHWTLDLLPLDHPLLPLKKGQRLTVKATRRYVDGQGSWIQVLEPSAESEAAVVQSGYFEQRLFNFFPEQWRIDDEAGENDLRNYTRILALTVDEVKSWIDTFPVLFDIKNCNPKYFPPIAKLLGYPLNRLDSEESQRLQIANAITFWRKKGTLDVFRLIFYLLDFDIDVVELWTEDYKEFHPVDDVGYPKATYPLGPPNDASELVENGGTWYAAPYFGIIIRPQQAFFESCDENGTPLNQGPGGPHYAIDCENCPDETTSASVGLSLDDLKYLLERIDQFRPAHTVLDFLRFDFELRECGPIPDDHLNWHVHWFPTEKGWFGGYCTEDDPVYFRRGLAVRDVNGDITIPGSTRPDQLGTIDLGVLRADAATPGLGVNAPTQPHINMNRNPQPGFCNPIEEFFWTLTPVQDEEYEFFMRRDGLGEGFYPLQEPVTNKDHSDWPSRNPASGTVTAATWLATTAYVVGDEAAATADTGFSFTVVDSPLSAPIVGEILVPLAAPPLDPSGILFPANANVQPGTVTISYTDAGATPRTATDDGTGGIQGADIASGSIDYATGGINLDYIAGAPTSDVLIDYIYYVAGLSGGTEPTWPLIVGATVVDGTVTWQASTKYPTRNGRHRYAERLTIRLETYTGP